MKSLMNVQIINKSEFELPSYATPLSAGMDLRFDIYRTFQTFEGDEEGPYVILNPGDRILLKTGLFLALPVGYEAQIRPRSGLAIKKGITVLNSPGTVDADYRGEVGVILINHGKDVFKIHHGERICQMVIAKHEVAEWVEVEELDETDRGEGGFGHTGK